MSTTYGINPRRFRLAVFKLDLPEEGEEARRHDITYRDSMIERGDGKMQKMKTTKFSIKTNVSPVGFPPVAETLPGAIERIVSRLKPEKIILFGSYAYGNPTPDSDVDLLVIMKTKAKEIDRYVAVSNLLYPRQFPLDIIVKTPKEIEAEYKKRGNFFMREILTKGKVLYERPR